MKSRPFRITLLALAVAGALAALSAPAMAGQHTATLVVPAGLTPNDLHVTFRGTGGTITAPSVVPPEGAGGSIGVGPGNTINVVWDAKLAPGTVVTLTFNTEHSPIFHGGGKWTNNGNDLGPVSAHPDSFSVNPGAPGASPLVLILIAMAVAGAGVVMLRRRVEA